MTPQEIAAAAAEEVWRSWMDAAPGMSAEAHRDPYVHAQTNQMRSFLDATARAMEAEGAPEETIARVLRRTMFGDPGPDAAQRWAVRMAAAAEMLRMPGPDNGGRLPG